MPMAIRSSDANKSSACWRLIIRKPSLSLYHSRDVGCRPALGVQRQFAFQNLGEKVDAKQRFRIALAPPVHCPLGAQKFCRTLGEIEQNLIGSAVEFLGK